MNAPAPDPHPSDHSVASVTSPEAVVPATEPARRGLGRGTPKLVLMALGALVLVGGGVAWYQLGQSIRQAQQDASAGQQVLRLQVEQLQQALQTTSARAALAQERADQVQQLHQTLQGLQVQSAAWGNAHQAQSIRMQLLAGLAQLRMQADATPLQQTLTAHLQALAASPSAAWQPVQQALQADAALVQRYQQQGRPALVAQLDRLLLDVDAWVVPSPSAAFTATEPVPTASTATAPPAAANTANALDVERLQAWFHKGLQTLSSWIQVQRLDDASVHVLTPSQTQLAQAQVQLQLLSLRMDMLASRDAAVKAGWTRLEQLLRVFPAQDLAASKLRVQVQQLAAQWQAGLSPTPDLQASLQALAALSVPVQPSAPAQLPAAP